MKQCVQKIIIFIIYLDATQLVAIAWDLPVFGGNKKSNFIVHLVKFYNCIFFKTTVFKVCEMGSYVLISSNCL